LPEVYEYHYDKGFSGPDAMRKGARDNF